MVSFLNLFVPRIAWSDVLPMMCVSLLGALIAGCYGILHDQITYTISPEYFTNLKFAQFAYADFGFGRRVFVATIGFLATWWVGAIAGWFLARRLIPNQPRDVAFRQICNGFVCILLSGFLFGTGAFVYGLLRGPKADFSAWSWAIHELNITDVYSFVRVAYIHNASYLGGVVGLLVALATIRPRRANAHATQDPANIENGTTSTNSVKIWNN